MHLKQLSIHGFKSFASKTVFRFAPGVTGVVGPNGSGKSNVADAIRWVMGEQSNKLLRAKKSEDVIFFGSEKKSQSSYAEVELVFDNEKGLISLPYKEVAIARRYYRSGESEYIVNGSKARLLDVVEIMAKVGLGQSNYSVVGQGMVDLILSASPLERKGFFDSAAGIKEFEIKRDKSQRKLDGALANMSRVKDIISEISPRLKALDRQMERQKERISVEKSLRDLQIAYYSFMDREYAKEIGEHRKKLEQSSKDIHRIETEIDALNEILEKSASAEPEVANKVSELKKLKERTQDERNSVRERLVVAEERLKMEKERSGHDLLSRLKNSLDALTKEKKQLDQSLVEAKNSGEVNRSEHAKAVTSLAEFEKELLSLRASYQESAILVIPKEISGKIQKSLDMLIGALKDISINPTKAEIENLIVDKAGAISGLKKLSADLFALDDEGINTISTALQTKEQEVRKIAAKVSELSMLVERFGEKEIYINERLADISHQITSTTKEIDEISSTSHDYSAIEQLIGAEKVAFQKIDAEYMKVSNELEQLELTLRSSASKYNEIQREIFVKQQELVGGNGQQSSIEVALAKVETRLEDLKSEVGELTEDMQSAVSNNTGATLENPRETKQEIEKLRGRLLSLGGAEDGIEEEYAEVSDRHEFLSREIIDLEKATSDLKKGVTALDELIKARFQEAFAKIDAEFRDFFRTIFNGGNAALTMKEDPESGLLGIEIVASPPGKKIQHLNTLSGGERSLTSIALICAFLKVNPSPFVVLDEVDAALDELNTHRFLKIIKELSKSTGFIMVTHNKETMKVADVLYGVTMGGDHSSEVISIRLEEAAEYAAV